MHKGRHERPARGSKISWKSGEKYDHGPTFLSHEQQSTALALGLDCWEGREKSGEWSGAKFKNFKDLGWTVERYVLTAVPLHYLRRLENIFSYQGMKCVLTCLHPSNKTIFLRVLAPCPRALGETTITPPPLYSRRGGAAFLS